MNESFFSRWSRRKQEVVQGSPSDEREQNAPQMRGPIDPPGLNEPVPPEIEPPLPTLQDAHALTPESDFQPFMRSGVGSEVRNLAMKKLFADPHFNVMDGLDIYIGDYSTPDPMPVGMLRQMASAQFLNLLTPEDSKETAQDLVADKGQEPLAQSPYTSALAEPQRHDDTDLQLQPNPTPANPSAEPGSC